MEAATGGAVAHDQRTDWGPAFFGIAVDPLLNEFMQLDESTHQELSENDLRMIQRQMAQKKEEVEQKIKMVLKFMDERQERVAQNVNAMAAMREGVRRHFEDIFQARAVQEGTSSEVKRRGAFQARAVQEDTSSEVKRGGAAQAGSREETQVSKRARWPDGGFVSESDDDYDSSEYGYECGEGIRVAGFHIWSANTRNPYIP